MTAHSPKLPFSVDPLIAEAKRRMRLRRLLVAAVMLIAIGAAGSVVANRSARGPGPAGPRSGGGSGALSAAGRVGAVRMDSAGVIGPLQMNRSNRAQVIAFAGKPAVERHARAGRGYAEYDVLGYACKPGAGSAKNWSESVIECRTAFYLVGGRLSLFFDQWQGPLFTRGRRYLDVSASGSGRRPGKPSAFCIRRHTPVVPTRSTSRGSEPV